MFYLFNHLPSAENIQFVLSGHMASTTWLPHGFPVVRSSALLAMAVYLSDPLHIELSAPPPMLNHVWHESC